jgi:hypothetical protein
MPELLALKNGLCLAGDMGFRKVLRNSDSTEAIRLVLESFVDFCKYKAIILDIRHPLDSNWEVTLQR